MKSFSFEMIHPDSGTHARRGVIHTPHGDIQTPSFVPVGTQATVKSMTPDDLSTLGVQLYFVNTYHMYLRPGIEVIKKFGGLHGFMHWDKPLMTDSGGFQVFSLGRNKRPVKSVVLQDDEKTPTLVKISDEGVQFRSHWDGSKHMFTPESSMQWQWALGSDIHIAFDDCTSYPVSEKKARESMERTHRWSARSLTEHKKLSQGKGNYQALYGSIQGSVYKSLREESAKFISSMDVDGIAIGGVSVGESKKEMTDAVGWIMPYLPEGKPRHLLGVGEIDDIFMLVEAGVDTFDCVQPTRLARMGTLLVHKGPKKPFELSILNSMYADDTSPIADGCACYTCTHFSRAYIHHLFHVRELLGYRLATMHNIFFIQSLVSDIRKAIENGSFLELKKQWL